MVMTISYDYNVPLIGGLDQAVVTQAGTAQRGRDPGRARELRGGKGVAYGAPTTGGDYRGRPVRDFRRALALSGSAASVRIFDKGPDIAERSSTPKGARNATNRPLAALRLGRRGRVFRWEADHGPGGGRAVDFLSLPGELPGADAGSGRHLGALRRAQRSLRRGRGGRGGIDPARGAAPTCNSSPPHPPHGHGRLPHGAARDAQGDGEEHRGTRRRKPSRASRPRTDRSRGW